MIFRIYLFVHMLKEPIGHAAGNGNPPPVQRRASDLVYSRFASITQNCELAEHKAAPYRRASIDCSATANQLGALRQALLELQSRDLELQLQMPVRLVVQALL